MLIVFDAAIYMDISPVPELSFLPALRRGRKESLGEFRDWSSMYIYKKNCVLVFKFETEHTLLPS